MNWPLLLATLALLASALAAIYARWSATEAKKANDIGRLNALLAPRSHYLALVQHQADLAKTLSHSPDLTKAAWAAYADLDTKLREVSFEIDKEHAVIVRSHT